MPDDGAVVHQEQIGDAAQAFECLLLGRANRFVAQVAAGSHDGKGQQRQQQMVQGSVGEHHGQVGIARGNRRGEAVGGRRQRWRLKAAQQDNGGFRTAQQPLFGRGHLAHCPDGGQSWEHQGEGLFLTVL